MRRGTVQLAVNPEAFEDQEGDGTVLIGPSIQVLDAMHHLMAYEVEERNGLQEIINPQFVMDYDAMQSIYAGCYQTATIRGRQYVLLMHPYAD